MKKIQNEFVVATKGELNNLRTHHWQSLGVIDQKDLTPRSEKKKLIKITLSSLIENHSFFMEEMRKNENIDWIAPNYLYEGDLQDVFATEGLTRDPNLSAQFHHDIMRNISAWDIETGKSEIVVAVTDDGIEAQHEDLFGNLYVNKNEIAENGIDDDQNGYVDDVSGWNMIDGGNVSHPSGSHGTHVAGIVAAVADNGLGVVGTASGVKVMPLKIYNGSWTSSSVAEAFTYASDNGARIITTSYNIDGMVDDKIYRAAVSYAYSKGVLLFNSAGNSDRDNPQRTQVEELVLVCSTIADQRANDKKSDFSNYGYNIHACAPGGGGEAGILSTLLNNKYGRMSGTSMAAPNAAATAALLWSNHPEWTRAQVLAKLLGTSDFIDSLNPNYKLKLGSGRINSYRALTEAARPLSIKRVAEIKDGVVSIGTSILSFQINGILDVDSTRRIEYWQIILDGGDGKFFSDDDIYLVPQITNQLFDSSRQVVLTIPPLIKGKYRIIAKSTIQDPFGQGLDGNGDGVGGDDYSIDFVVQ